jgi:hypothetical protein
MRLKEVFKITPELYLLAASVYYWTLTSNAINPIALVLIAFLLYQLISKNTTTGLLISVVFIALNLFLVLALLSELSEFTAPDQGWKQLLIMGTLFIGLNLLMGCSMFWKYIKLKMV